MATIALFFAGAFLCNAVPHLVSGMLGMPFPSPFAKPMGIGDSPPVVNFLWGFFNLLVGMFLLARHPVAVDFGPGFVTFLAGVLVMGVQLSHHFGKVMRNRAPK
jgi:hypothetical protein